MVEGDEELSSLVEGAADEQDIDLSLFDGLIEKAVVFRAGGWWFSIAPSAVLEINALESLNRAPSLPGHMLGLVVARNQLVPVIDMQKMWSDIPSGPEADNAERVVLIEHDGDTVGIRADEAHAIVEVLDVQTSLNPDVPFVTGASRWQENHVQRLDPAALIEACLHK